MFKRVIDILCRRPQWEAPLPYPVLIIAVNPNRSASRQVTYDEGLAMSYRLSAIFCETPFTRFSISCLEELVSLCILAKTEIQSKPARGRNVGCFKMK